MVFRETFYYGGKPSDSEEIWAYTAPDDIDFLDDFSGSTAACATGFDAASTQTITIKVDGSSVGTIVFSAGALTGTLATTATTLSLLTGERLSFHNQASADADFGYFDVTLRGEFV